jgi:phage portal protein BeeE
MRLWPARKTEEEPAATVARSSYDPSLSFDGFLQMIQSFAYGGTGYSFLGGGLAETAPGQHQEEIGSAFRSLSAGAYKSNGVVFACMLTRALHFSEARFQFQAFEKGRPARLFSHEKLQPLAEPWVGGTTGDLLTRMLAHVDLGGNAFAVRRPNNRIALLRPDWVTIIGGVPGDPKADAWATDAEVLGYAYQPGGPGSTSRMETFLADEVAHFAPIPDPDARFRGMSWLVPLMREVMGDKAMTQHKLSYFERGASKNLLIKLDVDDMKTYREIVEEFRDQHEGLDNAWKTMFLAAGADATVIGADLGELDYKLVQGAGETRIAAAARTPPVLVGLSEGLQGSSLNSGNYQAARRMFADGWCRPMWRNVAGSLQRIVQPPSGSNGARLWYDDRDISFLKEDLKDQAEVDQMNAATISTLIDCGFDPDGVLAAIRPDWNVEHSGLISVQLQPPGTTTDTTDTTGPPVSDQGDSPPSDEPTASAAPA